MFRFCPGTRYRKNHQLHIFILDNRFLFCFYVDTFSCHCAACKAEELVFELTLKD